MPALEFKGKQFVYSHHLSVPFRELKIDVEKSLPKEGSVPSLNDNLIIHGDNLEGLKALLPTHAGKVDCIIIDPPYNTGGDWCYDDKVNSPLMKEWIKDSANPVDKEDLERHDKWLCMMWPRLNLLNELLSEDGFLAVMIDDNEATNLGCLLDEIFGEENRVAVAPWQSDPSGGKQKSGLRIGHEYVLIYHKRDKSKIALKEESASEHKLSDAKGKYTKGRELLKWGANSLREDRPTMFFSLKAPDGSTVYPIRTDGKDGCWRFGDMNHYIKAILNDPEEAHWELRPYDDGVSVLGKTERWVPYEKIREEKKLIVSGSWLNSQGTNARGTEELKRIFGFKVFDTPKPSSLYEWVIGLCPNDDATVLDSFAGSGTVCNAVLNVNSKDGGTRRFIAVQIDEDIPQDKEAFQRGYKKVIDITRERAEKCINGYECFTKDNKILLEEKLTLTSLKKSNELLKRFNDVKEEQKNNFNKVDTVVKNGLISLIGEKTVRATNEGLGGSFTYCNLGEPIQVESLLTGEGMPSFEALAQYVFYTATGRSLDKLANPSVDGLIGETDLYRIHLFYLPDTHWLRSNQAALNSEKLEAIKASQTKGKRTIVFAVAKFMSQKELTKHKVEFCQLPYAVHRIMGN